MDYIELTETSRLAVWPDTDAENPREDWSMLTGFVKIGNRGDSRLSDVPPVHEDYRRIEEAHDHFLSRLGLSHFTDILYRKQAEAVELTERYLRVFYNSYIEYDYEHGGFWFVDPRQLKLNFPAFTDEGKQDKEAEIIALEQDTYRQWADGEVFGVSLERLVTYATYQATRTPFGGFEVDDPGSANLIDVWEVMESIGGNYESENWTPEHIALDYFALTDDETAALQQRIQ